MARIAPEGSTIRFMCDGRDGNCNVEFESGSYKFMEAYNRLLRAGWKAFKNGDVWEHACVRCYISWCRRAEVEPYATSEHVTYDEVRAFEGVSDTWSLEPEWWLEEQRKRRAAKTELNRRKRKNRSRNKAKPVEDESDFDERLYRLPRHRRNDY